MSALPSPSNEESSRALPPPAAGSLSAAVAAEQHALPADMTHATTAMQVCATVSVVSVDSAVDALHGGVTPVASSAAILALHSADSAPALLASSADSTKSLALAPLGSTQAQGEPLGSSGSKDTDEKQLSIPSSALIVSGPKAMLRVSSSEHQLSNSHGRISPPSHVDDGVAAAAGVGGSGASAASTSRSISSILADAVAAVSASFRQRSSLSSSAVAQHVGMSNADGSSAASSSPAAGLGWAAQAQTTHCLVVSMKHLSSQSDRDQLNAALIESLGEGKDRCSPEMAAGH